MAYKPKRSLNEAETRAELIDPILRQRGWSIRDGTMRLEQTPGGIFRDPYGEWGRGRGKSDYLLCIKLTKDDAPLPVAVIEAKKEGYAPDLGLQQGINYAKRFNVPFVFSSNGHQYVAYNDVTKETGAPLPMSGFPSHDTLVHQYQAAMQIDLRAPAARPLLTHGDRRGHPPRYYQDAAVRAVLEAIAQGRNRALLSLATGAGKTYLAVQLVKRLADAGQARKVLFVCDRTELRRNAHSEFHNVFGNDAQIVAPGRPATNARILFATYQTLDAGRRDEEANFLLDNYPPDYFSHIIIDECHRSAWGQWSEVLARNAGAVQIGLTATPRTLKAKPEDSAEARADWETTADNFRYFGEPVYEYTLTQANEDGYLAVAEVDRRVIDVDERGLSLEELSRLRFIDAKKGVPLTHDELGFKAEVTRKQFEHSLQLPERTAAMADDLFDQLLRAGSGDPHQKTIIFCVEDHHCDAVVAALNNRYAGWCADQGLAPADYFAFKCTALGEGHAYLPELRASSNSHFIAVTVRLLDAGVDVPAVRNIVFFVYLNSPIAFYQMVGRGTRLYESKLFFRVYDYTNATRLFGENFETPADPPTPPPSDLGQIGEPPPEPMTRRVIRVEGLGPVVITAGGDGVVVERNGRDAVLPTADYEAAIAERLRAEAPTLADFRARWLAPEARLRLMERLIEAGYAAQVLQELKKMWAFDLYDVLAEAAYRQRPLTRHGRAGAFAERHGGWLAGLPADTAATLRAVVAAFEQDGTRALENDELWELPAVRAAGGFRALNAYGRDVFREAKERVFAV